jgi:hypothetical protein
MTLVAAVAGRLVEPDRAAARFPASAVPRVAAAVHQLLEQYKPVALVASAARGADLLALTGARELGIRCRVVLPFGIGKFRRLSVGDDPDWTRRFDAAIQDAASRSDLVILTPAPTHRAAYMTATERILIEARDLAADGSADANVLALVVWDGRESGPNDHTAAFRSLALTSGCIVEEVLTN